MGIPERERFEEPLSLSVLCGHATILGSLKIKFGPSEKHDPHFSSNDFFTN